MAFLLLSEADVRGLLAMPRVIELVEAGLKKMALDEAENVPRSRCQTDHAMLHVLPAAAKGVGAIGLKSYTTTKAGATFFVQLFDGRTGELLALMQADHLGRLRTGAASGVATKYLANPEASRVAVLGSGKQARTQLEAVCAVRPITSAAVFSPTADRCRAFAADMAAALGIPVELAASAREAVRGAHVVCTATAAREPVLFGDWLEPGQHLNVAGSNFLAKSEIDAAVLTRCARVLVDSKDQCRLEAGDLKPYFERDDLRWADVREVGAVVAGRAAGRESAAEITLFKSVGIGLEDVVVAAEVVTLARERGVGREVEF